MEDSMQRLTILLEIIRKIEYKKIAYVTDCWTYLSGYRTSVSYTHLEILGLDAAAAEPMVAVVRCNGTCANRPRVNQYEGAQSCAIAVSYTHLSAVCSSLSLAKAASAFALRSTSRCCTWAMESL